jgi:hypothetical protein
VHPAGSGRHSCYSIQRPGLTFLSALRGRRHRKFDRAYVLLASQLYHPTDPISEMAHGAGKHYWEVDPFKILNFERVSLRVGCFSTLKLLTNNCRRRGTASSFITSA